MWDLIVANSLVKKYGQKTVVNNVGFDIKEGEVFGLLGPNGAGKTTTIKMLTGLSVPDEGFTLIDGMDIKKEPTEVKKSFRVVTQENTLDRDLSVRENLKIWSMLYSLENADRVIDEVLEKLSLGEKANEFPSKLSGGQQRRLMLARAMMGFPKALFLDEPSLGLDPQVRRLMWESIRQAKQNGTAVLLTTHYIEEADQLCDRVGIISGGALIRVDTPANLKAELGIWACENIDENGKESIEHFHERAEAVAASSKYEGESTVRKTTLEDVFLHLTGRSIK